MLKLSEKQELAYGALHIAESPYTRVFFGGGAGSGKMIPIDNLVLTQQGWVKNGDLKRGSLVIDPRTGRSIEVLHAHDFQKVDTYRISFDDFSYCDCCIDHLWAYKCASEITKIQTSNKKNKLLKDEWLDGYKVADVKKLIELIKKNKLLIPVSRAVQFTKPYRNKKHTLPIDPYILGLMLGDGHIKKKGEVIITTIDDEIIKSLSNVYDAYVTVKRNTKVSSVRLRDINKKDIIRLGLSGKISNNKFIPKEYLLAPLEDRYQLIRGLIDTDGYVDDRGHISYCTVSKELALNVQELARSLGCLVKITSRIPKFTHKGAYNVWIKPHEPEHFSSLSRKKVRLKRLQNQPTKRIVSIEKLDYQTVMRCITVNSIDGLYITNDYTVTHNSILGCLFQISRRLQYPETRGLIGRKQHSDLMKSTFKTFVKVYNQLAYPTIGELKYNGQSNTVRFPNGSEILFLDLAEAPGDPEFQRLGSFELTDSFVDECGECSKNAIDVLYSRIRHNLINEKPAMLLCSNPSYGWLKDNWISKKGVPVELPPKWKYIQAKVNDNPDKEFVKQYIETLNEMPLYHRLRLLDGSWDYQVNESMYYTSFNPDIVFKTGLQYDVNYPLLLAFDFNYDPCTVVLMQNIKRLGGRIRAIKEIQVQGGTLNLIKEIKLHLNKINWNGVISVTGDSSGHKRTSAAGVITDFEQIRRGLEIPQAWINYDNRSNMSLDSSRDLLNGAFHYDMIEIDSIECPQLAIDLQIAKPKNGTNEFVKDRDQFKLDCLDAFRYGFHISVKTNDDLLLYKRMYGN